ncbi:MAG: glycosyltransferase, partial [Sulfurovum sp.]|nr:glycosyltransferase [Sulfurovum sp.]
MSIVMTGGGTGGHLAIIKAVKEHLKEEELVYIGSTKGQDKQWFEQDDDFAYKYFFETRGVVNQGLLGKVKSLFM